MLPLQETLRLTKRTGLFLSFVGRNTIITGWEHIVDVYDNGGRIGMG